MTKRTTSGFDGLYVLVALSALSLLAALYLIFAYAPQERTMGIVQKIFYFHVPSAIAAYAGFFTACGASVVYLVRGSRRADVVARAGAEAGVLFCTVVLMSGPLWARKAWGAFWTGEPRLMLTLILLLTFLAYLVVRQLGGNTELTRRICAALAIIGVVDIPLVRYSVVRWRGHHPQVITGEGGGLAPEMQTALLVSFVAVALLFATFLWIRIRLGMLSADAEVVERAVAIRRQRLAALSE